MTREELINSEEFQLGNIEYQVFNLVCDFVKAEIEGDEESGQCVPYSRVNIEKVKSLLIQAKVNPRLCRRILNGDGQSITLRDLYRISRACGKTLKIDFAIPAPPKTEGQ